MASLTPAERYKLMVNTVTPRPIAWIVTVDGQGRRNAAPFSFFNAMLAEPPLLVVGISPDEVRSGIGRKDTLRAIGDTREFTIGLVCEDDAEAMSRTSAAAPPGMDELDLAGIDTRPAAHVLPPLIASAPVQFECRLWQLIEPAPNAAIVIGEVLAIHIADRFLDEQNGRLRIDNPAMRLVGRAHGAGWYWRGDSQFALGRPPTPEA